MSNIPNRRAESLLQVHRYSTVYPIRLIWTIEVIPEYAGGMGQAMQHENVKKVLQVLYVHQPNVWQKVCNYTFCWTELKKKSL